MMYSGTKVCHVIESVRSDSPLGHQRAKTANTKSAIIPQLMARSSPLNFYCNCDQGLHIDRVKFNDLERYINVKFEAF
jgi:hypothetical protein